MAEDLQGNLANYQLQLQQVEAALTTDSSNEDLQKLRKDLQEVTELTEELIKNALATSADNANGASVSGEAEEAVVHDWHSGDKCMAIWSEDTGYYEATIDEILEDGTCTVTFDGYDNTDVTKVSLLKQIDSSGKRSAEDGDTGPNKKLQSKKDLVAQQREYKRKKAQKKAQRMKAMDEERESEKNKWLDFNSKTFSKTNKGRVKKSIFATPDSVNGKVGVGTCGIGGKPMTTYSHGEKYRKH